MSNSCKFRKAIEWTLDLHRHILLIFLHKGVRRIEQVKNNLFKE